eukprot:2920010-Pleurochrysis_carterae.AAC.1
MQLRTQRRRRMHADALYPTESVRVHTHAPIALIARTRRARHEVRRSPRASASETRASAVPPSATTSSLV